MSQFLECFTNHSCQSGLGLGIGIGIGICIILASIFLLARYCNSKKKSIEIDLEMTKIEKDRFPDDQKNSLWITFDGDPNNKSELTSPSKEKDTQNKDGNSNNERKSDNILDIELDLETKQNQFVNPRVSLVSFEGKMEKNPELPDAVTVNAAKDMKKPDPPRRRNSFLITTGADRGSYITSDTHLLNLSKTSEVLDLEELSETDNVNEEYLVSCIDCNEVFRTKVIS